MIWTIENGICDYSDENYLKKKKPKLVDTKQIELDFSNCQFYNTMCPFDRL